MATPLLFCGSRIPSRFMARHFARRSYRGATLLELIIVLAIIGIMASMLFPALQAARSKADTTACQNNVRQVGFALAQAIDVMKRFPQPNRWTIDCLRFMEERALYDQIMARGLLDGAQYERPKLMRCMAQLDFSSTVPNVGICHYVLVIDRPLRPDDRGRVSWDIHDRPELKQDEPLGPWYIGPEISYAEHLNMLATMKGPHPSGLYYSCTGATLAGDN